MTSEPLGIEEERRLAAHCRKKIAELPTMPVAVSEMTPNEYAIFESLAAMCGLVRFLSDYLDPEQRAAIKASGLLGDI